MKAGLYIGPPVQPHPRIYTRHAPIYEYNELWIIVFYSMFVIAPRCNWLRRADDKRLTLHLNVVRTKYEKTKINKYSAIQFV